MQDNPLVSIICMVYNHARFLEQTFESFVRQNVNFSYEILVHDDASTDGSEKIINKYEKQYPGIFKVVIQKENQYSKGKKVYLETQKRARGKYIALCEGDDYWIDKKKLQKQVDYMEEHDECSLCVHAAKIEYIGEKRIGQKENIRACNHSRKFGIEELLRSDGGIFPTNSMLFRSKDIRSLPNFYNIAPIGDYPLMIYLSTMGEVYYMDDLSSVYRKGVENSWSERMRKKGDYYDSYVNKLNHMDEEINKYLNYRYDEIIKNKMNKYNFNYYLFKRNYKELNDIKYKEIRKTQPIRTRIHIRMGKYFSGLINYIFMIREDGK